jgi:hypothetical protein
MVRLVRLLNKLSQNSAYQTLLNDDLPVTARVNHGHAAVMMGYDFHLSPTGVKLIEVNTNAGGLWLGSLCYQPDATAFPPRLAKHLLQSFITDYALFSQNLDARPKFMVILDESPQIQFLYPEMKVFAQLFRAAGIDAEIAAPEQLSYKQDGLYLNDRRVEMIYNRHCDFYLATAAMTLIREAWMKGNVCLSPNPRVYGLLADKRRMIIWSNPELLSGLGLSLQEITLLENTVPQTLPLNTLTAEQAWETRKQWVFKPESGYGSRGVYVGDKLTKSKLAELKGLNTLIQKRIPASVTRINSEVSFKTDLRLFVYQQKVLAVSARLYQGQVTNLRTQDGGFAKVCVIGR